MSMIIFLPPILSRFRELIQCYGSRLLPARSLAFFVTGGMHHVDIGGNCEFLKDVTVDNLAELLHKIIRNPNIYKRMKANAEKDAADDFLYSSIARKALEIMPQNPSNN